MGTNCCYKTGAHIEDKLNLYDQNGNLAAAFDLTIELPNGMQLFDESDKPIKNPTTNFSSGYRIVYNGISYICHLSCGQMMLQVNEE